MQVATGAGPLLRIPSSKGLDVLCLAPPLRPQTGAATRLSRSLEGPLSDHPRNISPWCGVWGRIGAAAEEEKGHTHIATYRCRRPTPRSSGRKPPYRAVPPLTSATLCAIFVLQGAGTERMLGCRDGLPMRLPDFLGER